MYQCMMNLKNTRKKVLVLFLVFCFICLTACNHSNSKYLSITTTRYDDHGNLEFNVYEYSFSDMKEENKVIRVYNSQYPLSVYSQYDNKVYYTAKHEKNNGDQLFVYDLNTKESKMLTNNYVTINQIIPLNNNVYILGVMLGERLLKPSIYSVETGNITTFNKDDDLNFYNMNYDVFNQNLYFSAFYQKEDDKALAEANEGKGRKYISPNTHIFVLKNDVLEKIYSTNRKLVYRMIPQSNGNLTFTESESIPAWNPEYFTYSLNIDDHQKEPTINIDELMNVSEFAYYISKNEIVFLGNQTDENDDYVHRGIYLYNTVTKKLDLLFEKEDEHINNFILLNN